MTVTPKTSHVVGVADMKISQNPGDVIVTHALGSCIGIAIHDPAASVAGILHFMLPLSDVNPEKAAENPYMFADTGLPAFFRAAYGLGAARERLKIVMAGGAQLIDRQDFFAIGKRNQVMARKIFWKSNLLIDGEDVGGRLSRTLFVEVGTGRIWIKSDGRETEL